MCLRSSAKLILGFFIPFNTFCFAASEVSPDKFVLCKLKGHVRTIHIEKVSEGRCSTLYTKDGQQSEVWRGLSMASCQSILTNVQKNLEGGAWKCRIPAQSRILMNETPSSAPKPKERGIATERK
jgi:hypothetical protein